MGRQSCNALGSYWDTIYLVGFEVSTAVVMKIHPSLQSLAEGVAKAGGTQVENHSFRIRNLGTR
jgi:hypothetical protein